MAYRITTDVSCDLCGVWVHGCVDSLSRRAFAWQIAEGMDWIKWYDPELRQYLHVCPECQRAKAKGGE